MPQKQCICFFSVFNQYEFKTKEKWKLFDTLVDWFSPLIAIAYTRGGQQRNQFNTLVASVLHYTSELWGLNEGKDIEKIHTKFLRKSLCVKTSTNLVGLYGELGEYPYQLYVRFTCFGTG